jgi:hypothetical protein
MVAGIILISNSRSVSDACDGLSGCSTTDKTATFRRFWQSKQQALALELHPPFQLTLQYFGCLVDWP